MLARSSVLPAVQAPDTLMTCSVCFMLSKSTVPGTAYATDACTSAPQCTAAPSNPSKAMHNVLVPTNTIIRRERMGVSCSGNNTETMAYELLRTDDVVVHV